MKLEQIHEPWNGFVSLSLDCVTKTHCKTKMLA
jgi:hypothetical protein